MINAGIIGATGYAGAELTRLLYSHPEVNINFLCSNSYSGEEFSNVYSNFKNFVDIECINIHEVFDKFDDIDVLFTALPSGKALDFAKKALDKNVKVIDIGSDFRLKTTDLYTEWYNLDHKYPELLQSAVYGLPEINKEKIKAANLVANPGCYPTASSLAMLPLVNNSLIDLSTIIIDAKSGVSGAGRKASTANLFVECNESIKAYGVTTHRHTPEIEQTLSSVCLEDIKLTFTPHLVPMNRGILSVCYSNLKKEYSLESLFKLYKEFYKTSPFVRVIDSLPETRWVKGSNFCDITLRLDTRTNRVIAIAAIDNLIKGAAGQAIQNMNIMFGLNETTAIKVPAIFA